MKHSNFLAAFLQIFILSSLFKSTFSIRKSYIVALGAHFHDDEPAPLVPEKIKRSHHRVLGKVFRSTSRAQRKIHYSYENHLNAFSVHLTEKEAARLTQHPEVISILESTKTTMETTHSMEFLGFEKNGEVVPNSLWEKAKYGEDMIIAGVDSGIWPESKSYSDEGMDLGPIPPKWKGVTCDLNPDDGPTCNRKLIGARVFDKAYMSICIEHMRDNMIVDVGFPGCVKGTTARDKYDHGTHTLATAGGSFVAGANLFGQANGTAKGSAPRARLVGYKLHNQMYDYKLPNGTLNTNEAYIEGDKLAAFDDAIGNGADVITMSLSNGRLEFSDDATSIAAFHAVMRGIVFVAAAANAGSQPETVKNLSPWMISVGSSTINRKFTALVVLGNNQSFKGISLYEKENSLAAGTQYPLITCPEAKFPNAADEDANNCEMKALDPQKLKGKILICPGSFCPETSVIVEASDGVGIIIYRKAEEVQKLVEIAYCNTLVPSVGLIYSHGQAVLAYHNSTSNATAYLSPLQTEIIDWGDPIVNEFSARGPNPIEPSVLKPDIIAPGGDILGPSCGGQPPTNPFWYEKMNDTRRVPFLIFAGTSFAVPHVAGIAALLKSIHPDWSPAAIKSALMTTATTTQYINNTEPLFNASMVRMTPFEYGAGHVNPNRADDPGLVYDLTLEDYLNFLCARGYDERRLKLFHAKPYTCPPTTRLLDFNYPAITIPNLDGPVTVTRRLKNVGPEGTYTAKVNAPPGIDVTVEPLTLAFGKVGEEQVYKAEFRPIGVKVLTYVFGELTWSDGAHFVKIPLSVKH